MNISQDKEKAEMDELDELDSRFSAMVKRVEKIDLTIDPRQPESLRKAERDLGHIISDLEKLQSTGLPGIDVRGSSEIYGELSADIRDLLLQTKQLKQQISQTLPDQSIEDSEETIDLLGREEIAKLLLVVSRAFSIQRISAEQRSFIKDEICRKKGYLRAVLEADDIFTVMNTLASIRPQYQVAV